MKSTRDSQRLSELQTITKAIGLYLGDGKSSVGTANIVYVSIPDSSATCANLGLPSLPAGWSYQCSTEPNYRKTDGTGWIPIAFNTISFGNTLDTLPIDPVNATTSLNYYTYITGGSFELTAAMESFKYKMGGSNDVSSKDNGSYPELYEMGSNLTLLPVNYGDTSLVGYWKFDEGSGTVAYDASGHGNNGTLYSSTTAVDTHQSSGCKFGNGCLNLDGVNDYVKTNIDDDPYDQNNLTLTLWIKTNDYTKHQSLIGWLSTSFYNNYGTGLRLYGGSLHALASFNSTSTYSSTSYNYSSFNQIWTNIAMTLSQSGGTGNVIVYINGQQVSNYSGTIGSYSYAPLGFGGTGYTDHGFSTVSGLIDDVRFYNRALSAAEVGAIYNATNK